MLSKQNQMSLPIINGYTKYPPPTLFQSSIELICHIWPKDPISQQNKIELCNNP